MVKKTSSRSQLHQMMPLAAAIFTAFLFALLIPETSFAGYCAGGIDYGKPCSSSLDCRKTCAGGVDVGQACLTDSSCRKTCAGGIDVGKACISDSSCRMTCYGGSRGGQACTSSVDCPGSGSCLSTTCLGTTCLGTSCVGSFAADAAPISEEDLFFASLDAASFCAD